VALKPDQVGRVTEAPDVEIASKSQAGCWALAGRFDDGVVAR
jgi:hypothetical protein